MKITLTSPVGLEHDETPYKVYGAGQELDVSDERGKSLVASGLAVRGRTDAEVKAQADADAKVAKAEQLRAKADETKLALDDKPEDGGLKAAHDKAVKAAEEAEAAAVKAHAALNED